MGAKTVLYLHGFASSPAGRKVTSLRETLSPEGFQVVAPDLNRPSFRRLDFGAMVGAALGEAGRFPPAAVVGSSLGALVALEAARRGLAAPLVLLAPALDFGERWTEKLPDGETLRFFHHGAGEERPIHRAFFEQMASVDCDREPPSWPVTVIMGRKDESVPFPRVEAAWCRWVASKKLPAASRFVEVPEGDHGLLGFVPRIAEEIRASAAVRSTR